MWQIIVIIICLGFNALLAATELAFIAMGKARLKHLANQGKPAAVRVLTLRENPEKTLSILQLGITFIGVVAAAVGGVLMDQVATPWLMDQFGLGEGLSEVLAIAFFVIPYTYVNIVLSELLPKSLALRNPKWVIFHMERGLVFLGKILAPFVYVVEKSTKFLVKIFSSLVNHEEVEAEDMISVGKLVRPYMLKLAKIEGKFVKDVMIPWKEVDKLKISLSIEDVKKVILRTGHTRLPLMDNGNPIALLQSKEFIAFLEEGNPNWQTLQRPLIKLGERDSLIHALRVMQGEHSHLSLVLKEGEPMGIVTIEDILEEIVGEIYDEDDIGDVL
ncbi:MAG: Hemolysin C [Chlamydiae bacterium]|nr:Hemolysin C [Chlamydiota bacterium]